MLAFVLLAVLSGLPHEAAVYYVAATGDDSNTGDASAPFRSIQRAVDAAQPGDTILVRDGTYGAATCSSASSFAVNIAKAGTESAYISIRSENPYGATLDAESRCHSYFNLARGAAYISISGFVITRGFWAAIWSNNDAHHIRISFNRIEAIGNRAETSRYGISGIYTGPDSSYFHIDSNIIHDIGRTSGAYLWHDHGLYLHGRDLTVVNNVFYNLRSGWPICPTGPIARVLIAHNTFAFQNPIRDGHIAVGDGDVNSLVIRNNIFHQPRGAAIVHCAVRYAGANVIENNMVSGAVLLGPEICGATTGLESITVRGNFSANPSFVNATAPPFDFTLRSDSPAIDAGAFIPGLSFDARGTLRPQGAASDLGAYEYTPPLGVNLR